VRPVLRATLARLLNLALALTIFLVCWIALAAYLRRNIMPYPWEVCLFGRNPGELWHHTVVSAGRAESDLFAVIIATPIGPGWAARPNRIFSPIALVHPIPKIALPVILVIMGIDETESLPDRADLVLPDTRRVARDQRQPAPGADPVGALIGSRRRAVLHAHSPASLPAVLTAPDPVGTAIAVLFIAEQWATSQGLGYYIIILTWQRIRYEEMYAGILAMSPLDHVRW
jgi:NitT/TauT family transport system permease protein